MEKAAQLWEAERILFGPYDDDSKKRVYLCEVRKADFHQEDAYVEEEWREIEERFINPCTIRAFHKGSNRLHVRARPTKRRRGEGEGGGASRGVGSYTCQDKVLQGVRYVSAGSTNCEDFYEQNTRHDGAYCDVETPNVKCTLVGWDEVLQPGCCVELRSGGYVFIRNIRFQATDGEVDLDSVVFQGLKLLSVASLVKCDGSDVEAECGEASVVASSQDASISLADVDALVPAVPASFWEDGNVFDGKVQWLGHMVGNGVQADGTIHVVPLSKSAMARYGWAAQSFSTQAERYYAIHTALLKKFDVWLRKRVTTKSTVVTETLLWFRDVPPGWMYWVLGRAWFEEHPNKARYLADTRMHEFAGSTTDFQRVFRRDIGKRISYSEEIAASVGEAGTHPAVTFRFSMERPGMLLLQLGSIRKHINARITWDTSRNQKLVKDTFKQCPCCWIDLPDDDSDNPGTSDLP